MSILLALQPCLDRHEHVRAYAVGVRLVHEGGTSTFASVLDVLLAEGMARVTGGHPALLRIDRAQLREPSLRRLSPAQAMFVVDGTADADAVMDAAAAGALADAGYGLVVELPAAGPVSPALVEHAKLLLLDVGGAAPSRMAPQIASARTLGRPVLVRNAPPTSTAGDWGLVGAGLVQWAALAAAPRRERGGATQINDANALKLLGELRDPRLHDSVLEEGFKRDLGLSYELLKLVNSAAVAGREVYSIGHAIRLLGREVIHRRLATLVLRSLGDRGMRAELAMRALVRGRFCELLADEAGVSKAAAPLFTTGFLSLLPDLLGIPVSDLHHRVTLAPDVRNAIEHRAEFYGAMLGLVEAWEGERWDGVLVRAAAEGLAVERLAGCYLAAVGWAREQLAPQVVPA